MKKNFKRTLSLILAVLMVMTVVPFSGMASDATPCDHANAVVVKLGESNGEIRHYVNSCPDCGVDGVEVCDGPDATSCGEAKKCAICDQVIGAALDHTFAPGVEDETTLKDAGANCQVANTYYETCTECGAPSDNDEDVFPSETNFGPHDWDEGTKTYDDCEEEGVCTYKCEIDNCEAERSEEVEARGHDFTAKVEDPEYLVPNSVATCDKGAEYYYACANENCDAIGTETYFSEVTGNHVFHELEDPDFLKDEATCSKDAVYYKWCSVCTHPANQLEGCEDETFTVVGSKHDKPTTKEGVVDPSAEDEEKYLIANADCLNNALYSKLCKDCGEPMATTLDEAVKEGVDYYEKANSALNPGHADLTKMKLVGQKIEPTCTKKGQEAIYHCEEKDCNVEVGGEIIPAKNHAYDTSKAKTFKDAECGKNGHYGRKYCPDCNTSFFFDGNGKEQGSATGVAEKTIKAIDHVNKQGGDDLCDNCGTVVKPSETCSCICHKGGFMYIVALILKFFWRFMGTREYCECSTVEEIIKHY